MALVPLSPHEPPTRWNPRISCFGPRISIASLRQRSNILYDGHGSRCKETEVSHSPPKRSSRIEPGRLSATVRTSRSSGRASPLRGEKPPTARAARQRIHGARKIFPDPGASTKSAEMRRAAPSTQSGVSDNERRKPPDGSNPSRMLRATPTVDGQRQLAEPLRRTRQAAPPEAWEDLAASAPLAAPCDPVARRIAHAGRSAVSALARNPRRPRARHRR